MGIESKINNPEGENEKISQANLQEGLRVVGVDADQKIHGMVKEINPGKTGGNMDFSIEFDDGKTLFYRFDELDHIELKKE